MKTAVTSMCIGEANRPMRNLTFPTILDYADRIGADFINITAGFGERFLGIVYYEKLQIINLLEIYDRVIFIDADVIVSPDCPCLLDLVPPDHFGAFIASRYSNFHNQANIEIQKKLGKIEWKREQRDSHIFESFNSGVMVLSRQHLPELKQALPAADIWCRYPGPPVDPRTFLNDQTVLNYTIQKHQIPISDLTYRFNHTNAKGDSADRFSSHMIHYAGSSHRKSKRLISTSKLTKMKVDAAILSCPWLHKMVKKWPQLAGLLDNVV